MHRTLIWVEKEIHANNVKKCVLSREKKKILQSTGTGTGPNIMTNFFVKCGDSNGVRDGHCGGADGHDCRGGGGIVMILTAFFFVVVVVIRPTVVNHPMNDEHGVDQRSRRG